MLKKTVSSLCVSSLAISIFCNIPLSKAEFVLSDGGNSIEFKNEDAEFMTDEKPNTSPEGFDDVRYVFGPDGNILPIPADGTEAEFAEKTELINPKNSTVLPVESLGGKKTLVTQGLFVSDSATSKYYPIHMGVDMNIRYEKIHAPFNAEVLFAGEEPGWGNVVGFRSTDKKYFVLMAHMQDFGSGTYPGATLKKNDFIGTTGNTGNSTAPHLHIEFYKNGVPQDEYAVMEFFGSMFSGSDDITINENTKFKTSRIRDLIQKEGLYDPADDEFFKKIEEISTKEGIPEKRLFALKLATEKNLNVLSKAVLGSGTYTLKGLGVVNNIKSIEAFTNCLYAKNMMGYGFDCSGSSYARGREAFSIVMEKTFPKTIVAKSEKKDTVSVGSIISPENKGLLVDLITGMVKEFPVLIGCYVGGEPIKADSECRGNPLYLPQKKLWDIYKSIYNLEDENEKENFLISITQATLESRFDPNANGGMTKYGEARGLYQMLPDWGTLDQRLDPEWQITLMKKTIDERLKRYDGNIRKTFQKHYGFVDGAEWYGVKYEKVYNYYTSWIDGISK